MNHSTTHLVTIRWTDNDIPHIEAQNYYALGFGYGSVHAQDRLAEISAQAIVLRGQRSKYFGAEHDSTIGFLKTTNLNSDLMFRLRLPHHWVKTQLEQLNIDTRHYIEGYVDGLNHFVDNLSPQQRAHYFIDEPMVTFEPEDVIRAAMRFGIMKEMIEIGPHLISSSAPWSDKTSKSPTTFHQRPVEIEGGFGSNGWAFGGNVTDNNSAILLSNPHSAWKRTPHEQRIYMHQYHLTIPGKLDVAGCSFLGFPFPMTGYNANVSWTILDAASVTPFLLHKMHVVVDSSNDAPLSYWVDGQSHPISLHHIAIDVLGENGITQRRHFSFAHSELGPLYKLPATPTRPEGWYAITNPNENNARGLDQFLGAAQSTSTREFVRAIEHQRGILCQLLVADQGGDVAYVISGNVPPIDDAQLQQSKLKSDTVAFNILDGSQRNHWLRDSNGAPSQAPCCFYPTLLSRDVIHNANNSYKYSEWGKTQPDFPAVFGQHKPQHQRGKHIAAGVRYDPRLVMSSKRIAEIRQHGPITAERALSLLFDNRNYAAETFLDQILQLEDWPIANSNTQALQVLALWDRKNNAESKGALLFHLFWRNIIEANLLSVPSDGNPALDTQLDLSVKNILKVFHALDDATQQLFALGFNLDIAWGEVLYLQCSHEKIPLHGGSYQEGILNGAMPAPLTKHGFPYILFGSAYIQLTQWHNHRIIVDAVLSHGQKADIRANRDSIVHFSNKQLQRIPFLDEDFHSNNTQHSVQRQCDRRKPWSND